MEWNNIHHKWNVYLHHYQHVCCDSIVTLNLTITPTEDATFAYGASSYCASATDPTPTVSGVSGGVFNDTTGLVINSSTGAIDWIHLQQELIQLLIQRQYRADDINE